MPAGITALLAQHSRWALQVSHLRGVPMEFRNRHCFNQGTEKWARLGYVPNGAYSSQHMELPHKDLIC